jgi:alpha-1,6-mannosyltransferase
MSGVTGAPGSPPAVPAVLRAAGGAAGRRTALLGRTGLAATAGSIVATVTVAALGPSVMEPALPGRPGQPPWAAAVHPAAGLAVALAAAALAAGTAGLGLCLYAARRGWTVPPRLLLAAGLLAAAVLALAPPFGSSDHLSYAAYGQMAVTGHDPYTTTPAALAALGDPVARAVQDWRHSPSVYGALATAGQALAAWAGGGSARLTVFVLSLLDLAAFAVTALLLHRHARGSREGQLRAALLWACNPLVLGVLVAGQHVDGQAIVFAVAAVSLFGVALPDAVVRPWVRRFAAAAGAGAAVGLAFAVKLSMLLVLAGLAAAAALAWWPRRPVQARMPGSPSGGAPPGSLPGAAAWRGFAVAAGGLLAGFVVTAALSFVPWGLGSLHPALRAGSYVSIGSPWRAVRSGLRLLVGEQSADNAVKAAAVVLALALAALLARPLLRLAGRPRRPPSAAGRAGPPSPAGRAGPPSPTGRAGLPDATRGLPGAGGALGVAAVLGPACALAAVLAWLMAWPYVLPWYDGLAWALLAMLPWLPPPWAALDWLVLARTAALAFGYLPARGIVMPAYLGWLRTVVRTGVTPVILLAVLAVMVAALWPRQPAPGRTVGERPS